MSTTNIKLHWLWCCTTVRMGMCYFTKSIARGLEMSIRFLKKTPKLETKPPVPNKQQEKNPKQLKSFTIHKELIWELCFTFPEMFCRKMVRSWSFWILSCFLQRPFFLNCNRQWLLKRDNLWILGLFWLVISSTAFSIRKNISCFGVFYKHGTYPSLTNVAKRKKFAQPSLASALVVSGSSGNKVQDCLRMTGTKFYLKEEWRGLHRWLHHMPFSCFSIWTTFIVSVFLMFLKNWEKYLLKACGWKLNKINQAWYRKLIKN